jgi:hypothetical protein
MPKVFSCKQKVREENSKLFTKQIVVGADQCFISL